MKLKLQFIIVAFIGLVLYIPVAHGQARLRFSGGNGTRLTTTLRTAVTYTITNSNCVGSSPFFVFQAVGTPFDGVQAVTGTINFSIDNAASEPIFAEGSNVISNDLSANDVFVNGNTPGVNNGSMVVLSAGAVTTDDSVAAPPPDPNSFITFIINNEGIRCSSDGVSLAPTAASVSISGRVLLSKGRGLSNAFVYLTDQNGNIQVRRTNPFGYYRFENVQVGQTATVTVVSKRLRFAPQVLNLNEEVTQLNFIAGN